MGIDLGDNIRMVRMAIASKNNLSNIAMIKDQLHGFQVLV